MNFYNINIELFILCYVDLFYPHVGKATLELLQKLGLDVQYSLKVIFSISFNKIIT